MLVCNNTRVCRCRSQQRAERSCPCPVAPVAGRQPPPPPLSSWARSRAAPPPRPGATLRSRSCSAAAMSSSEKVITYCCAGTLRCVARGGVDAPLQLVTHPSPTACHVAACLRTRFMAVHHKHWLVCSTETVFPYWCVSASHLLCPHVAQSGLQLEVAHPQRSLYSDDVRFPQLPAPAPIRSSAEGRRLTRDGLSARLR